MTAAWTAIAIVAAAVLLPLIGICIWNLAIAYRRWARRRRRASAMVVTRIVGRTS